MSTTVQEAVRPAAAPPPATSPTGEAPTEEAPTEEAPGGAPLRLRWLLLAVVTGASFLDSLDVNIVTVVLPAVQRDLGTEFATAQWTLAGYALAFSLFLITGGRLGDIHGRKRVFLAGVAGFTLASAVCGFAPNAELLVAARLLQGLTAALMVPQVMSVIVTLFRPKEWPVAFAVLGAALTLGSVGGPLLGGLLTGLDLFGLGWRVIFLVNVPLGLLITVLAARLLPENRQEGPTRLDLPGVALLTAAAFALMYPLVQGREQGWPAWMLASALAAPVLLVLFARHQRRRHARDGGALVPPPLFARRSFAVGLAVTLLAFTGIGSLALILTYHLQYGLGWSVLRTALATAAWPVGIAVTFQIAWRHGMRRGRLFVGAGAAVMAAGSLLLMAAVRTAGADLSWWQVAGAELVVGFGMGLCSPVLASTVLSEVPPQDSGAGSGVVNAVTQFGSAAGVAVVGAIFLAATGDAAGGDVATDLLDPARIDRFCSATGATLWYNAGAFALTALLSRLLPAPATTSTDTSAEGAPA
ncbi:MFS transporter [Kitasatospora sp. NPDC051170]|uniref:MFS transporter n=1 Tax=Kitasatospora sp. NPDC051170 TaxID=3364056 RepID=UPI00378BDB16